MPLYAQIPNMPINRLICNEDLDHIKKGEMELIEGWNKEGCAADKLD